MGFLSFPEFDCHILNQHMEVYRVRRYYGGLSYVFFQIRVEKVIKLLQRNFWEGLDDVTKGGGFSIELQRRF